MDGPILPRDLPLAIDAFPDISVLSLDCFDTLLWRDCHAPSDVFTALPGVNIRQRVWAERAARIEAMFRHQRSEVMLPEIYRQLLPNADDATIAAHAAAEVHAETQFCFGFAPTIDLMRRARARGLKVIIVSDTYLDRDELAGLIAATAGPAVLALIDAIYCSSEYGASKASGLLKTVAEKMAIAPDRILHIGDNPRSDFAAAQAAGINALHLVQFEATTQQRLRLEASVSTIIHSRATSHDLPYQPHRATLAVGEPAIVDPATAFGYATLGPILDSFTSWIASERAALQARTDCTVHTLFLMRDGYLPRQVFEAGQGNRGTSHAVEISRYTATAAAFTCRKSVMRFVEQNVGSGIAYLLNQLLYTPAEAAKTMHSLPKGANRSAAFMRTVGSPQSINRILARSAAMAQRMCAHIESVVAPAQGDTLMFIDLGYNGSVQNLVEPVLGTLRGWKVAGRYLLYRAQQLTGYDKSGLVDEGHYDMDTLLALASNVAVIEQLCTIAQGSVIDYRANGSPVRADTVIKGRQNSVRDNVQAGCLAFALDAASTVVRQANPNATEARRRSAAATLARLMFLPQKHELEIISRFEHDVNLGTAGTVRLFDSAIAEKGMRERGLFYLKNSERMYLPAELHGQGMPISLSMLALKRFNLDLQFSDFCDRQVALPLLIADGHAVSVENIVATPTHDGYFVASVPIGAAKFTVAAQFGKLYDVVEVLAATFRPVTEVVRTSRAPSVALPQPCPTLEGMEALAPGLFRCSDEAGFMMIPPPPGDHAALVLEIVFRCIVARQPAAIVDTLQPISNGTVA